MYNLFLVQGSSDLCATATSEGGHGSISSSSALAGHRRICAFASGLTKITLAWLDERDITPQRIGQKHIKSARPYTANCLHLSGSKIITVCGRIDGLSAVLCVGQNGSAVLVYVCS